jgi:hypothetical protein
MGLMSKLIIDIKFMTRLFIVCLHLSAKREDQ